MSAAVMASPVVAYTVRLLVRDDNDRAEWRVVGEFTSGTKKPYVAAVDWFFGEEGDPAPGYYEIRSEHGRWCRFRYPRDPQATNVRRETPWHHSPR